MCKYRCEDLDFQLLSCPELTGISCSRVAHPTRYAYAAEARMLILMRGPLPVTSSLPPPLIC